MLCSHRLLKFRIVTVDTSVNRQEMLLAAVALAVGDASVHMDIILNKVKSKLKGCQIISRFYNIC